MPVIAMTQEMGSLAKDVSIRLAEEMGLAVMRHEVLDHVAGRMNVPKSLIGRLREGKAGLVEAEKVATGVQGVTAVDNQLRMMGTSRRFTSAKHY